MRLTTAMLASQLKERRLALFGGQGSSSIFSPNAATAAEEDARSVSIGNILLSKCHAAFLEEITSLDTQSQHLLDIDTALFGSPRDLLKPSAHYHTHPVLQATTIYLCQLLRYLVETQRRGETCEHSFDRLHETAGFSSGILPAAVVARSRSLDDFLLSGLQGFRLAFWIACRSFFWTLTTNVGDHVWENVNSEATLSLVTRGLSRIQVEDSLSQHYDTHHSGPQAQQGSRRMQISAVSSSGAVSISGPKTDLAAFQAQAPPYLTTTFAFVHGWYHGGNQLEGVVQEVLKDARRRAISFPPCSAPAKSMYSTLDGTLLDVSKCPAEEFLGWLTRHLLIHCVNWCDTTRALAANVRSLLERQPDATVNILSFGPSSGSLFPHFEPFDPRIVLSDLSPFKNSGKPGFSIDHQNSIAVVGMSVQLPKGEGTEELWETISQGLNAVQVIPENRFRVSDYFAEDVDKPRSMPTKYGAFLKDPFSFDNAFFNISPREAKSMDPQQRVLLHAAQEALEDAGYVEDSSPSFQRATTGCYIGLATGDYTDNLRNNIDVFYPSGTLRAFHSGRISYFYRLSGPSMVTDTACSSSTVSIYQACRALQNGDCTTAIAGGANVITSPDMYLGLARGHFLSRTGGCKPFDAAADGYCRAEGCVLFVLKRLSDAVAEGDRIHGVIRNVVINQSGNSNSITHPHSQTQTDLLRRLLQQTNVDPGSVGVVEAHGTGTQAGDAREVESLNSVFGPHHSTANPLVISSIKGNIGHCEAASGAAGLAKLLLMLRERKIPLQAGLKNINPSFATLPGSGLIIPRRTMPWDHSQRAPRRAVLNNFGAAGSNASLLLEDWVEPPSTQREEQDEERSAYVFALSAKSERALQSALTRHVAFLGKSERRPSLIDVCYTATARRHIHDYRISVVCTSIDDLLTKLRQYKVVAAKPSQPVAAIVFLFSGQGALYRGMGQELMSTTPPFRDIIMSCDRIVQRLGYPSILGMFFKDQGNMNTLNDMEHIIASQCACVALEYALAKLFMSWGIMPDHVMGHSLGEYAALCVAGALTLDDTFHVVASRAKMMGDNCLANTTGMLACNLSHKKAEAMISENPRLAQLTIACVNGIGDCVIGGPLGQLDIFQKHCKTRKVKTKLLDVPYAFHTSAMDPILEPLRALGRSIEFGRPTIPVMSNVHGRLFEDADFTSDYFALHARHPVRFADGLLSLQSNEAFDGTVFLEIGPQPTLLPVMRTSILPGSCSYLGTLQKGQDAWKSMSETLAAISLYKTPVKWRMVFAGTSARVTSLPGHLLEGSSFLIPFQESRQSIPNPSCSNKSGPEATGRIKTGFSLLPWLNTRESSDKKLVLETEMAILGPLVSGHDVGGMPICPASVFHELAVEAAQILLEPPETRVLVVSGMSFANPLVHKPSQEIYDVTVSVYITKHDSSSGAVIKITSCSTKDFTEILHCTGSVSVQDLHVDTPNWVKDHAIVVRQSRYFSGTGRDYMNTFRTKVIYEAIFTRVVRYSPEYQSLVFLNVADSNLEGIGSFKLPTGSQAGYLSHPVFTDTLLHAAGFIANLAVGSEEIGICTRVESIEIAYRNVDYSDVFTIYCSLLEVKDAILAEAIALNRSGNVVAVVRGMEFKRLRLSNFQQLLSRMSPTTAASRGQEYDHRVTAARLQLQPGLETPPTSDEVMSSSTEPHSDSPFHGGISQLLKDTVVAVGGFAEQDIDYTKSLDELGIDSLMQIEIVSRLARMFPGQTGLSHHALSECETLEAMDDMLSSILQPSAKKLHSLIEVAGREASSRETAHSSDNYSYASDATLMHKDIPVTLHVSTGNHAPLFLFHDGSGQVGMYARLCDHDRTTYAFCDPYFGSDKRPHRSINQMAEYYVSKILAKLKDQSALILGGWSFGGVVAFEAAQQLTAHGLEVKGLILIDSPSPIDHEPLPAEVIFSITKPRCQSHLISGNFVALEKEFSSNAYLLETYEPGSFNSINLKGPKTVMLRSQDILDTEALYGVRYDWLSRQDTRTAAIVDWEELVGGQVEVFPIPGNHFEPFLKENIGQTAAQLWKACQYIEGFGRSTPF